MVQALSKKEISQDDPVLGLQREIAVLEAALDKEKQDLRCFEIQIHTRLDREIARIRDLSELYKKQKKAKKAKRLEQKKRGKNYQEPKQLKRHSKPREEEKTVSLPEQQELRRLYKEAVLQVHPDKIHHGGEEDKIQQATSITAQLNGIYKRGDLEELINFYQFIMNENVLSPKGFPANNIVDPKVRLVSLKKKKEAIALELEKLKNSYTYKVLTTYEDPLLFIDELYIQLQERILQLEKRTRKG